MIREERAALVDALAGLPADSWDRRSLCPEWTVRDVVGHLIATARMTPVRFFTKMAGTGFKFHVMTARDSAAVTANRSPAELVDLYRAEIDARTSPPGPTMAMLGESIVHGEDIFRALGGYRPHPVAHVLAAADFFKGSDLLIGTKRRISGVTLRATDADWSTGTGPEVTGPAVALLLAMTGRDAALADLSGEGVAVLRGR